jgi:4-methyl-5(b-hydroxyethyl)-thiazole monophosphate biosynthesis
MVYLFLADGFETIEALAVVDVLRRAGIGLQTVGVTGAVVTSAHAVAVTADISLDDWDGGAAAEMLVLPGGPGVQSLAQCEALKRAVTSAMEQDRPVAAICAAPVLLGTWGLLQNRRVTCYPPMEGQLAATGALFIRDESVVVDRRLVTGSAAGASVDFALRIVALLRDGETADHIRNAIGHGAHRSLT